MDVRFSEDLLLDEEFIISQEKIKVQEEEEPSLVEEEVNEKKKCSFWIFKKERLNQSRQRNSTIIFNGQVRE